jgi:hypothetical protein
MVLPTHRPFSPTSAWKMVATTSEWRMVAATSVWRMVARPAYSAAM